MILSGIRCFVLEEGRGHMYDALRSFMTLTCSFDTSDDLLVESTPSSVACLDCKKATLLCGVVSGCELIEV